MVISPTYRKYYPVNNKSMCVLRQRKYALIKMVFIRAGLPANYWMVDVCGQTDFNKENVRVVSMLPLFHI